MRRFILSLLVLNFITALYANTSVSLNLANRSVAQDEAAALVPDFLKCRCTDFTVISECVDLMGNTHIALQQTLDGSPIHGATVFVHCKDGKALSLNGQYVADANLPQPVKAISKAAARTKAGAPQGTQVAMVIVQTPEGQMRWAYETVNLKKQTKVWIDAETGATLRSVSLRHSLTDVKGTANTLYMGIIPMTSVLTDAGDYQLFDQGRKIYTYDASQWDIPLFNEIVSIINDENKETDAESPFFEETAVALTAAFDQLISTSKVYTSPSADWHQTEIRKVSIELLDEQWAEKTLVSPLFCAIIADKDGEFKEETTVFDFEASDVEEEEEGDEEEEEMEDDDPIVLTFKNVCHVEPTDVVIIFNVRLDKAGSEVLEMKDLATFSIADALNADGHSLADGHLSCEMDLYNGPWLDVHAGMQAVFDYYKNVLGRDSYDDKGTPIRQFVNVPHDENEFEAFPMNACAVGTRFLFEEAMEGLSEYCFDFMAYGAGDGEQMSSIVAFDVLAHEYTHLVTNYRGIGTLEYKGESGALNEAVSDIMACAIGHGTG